MANEVPSYFEFDPTYIPFQCEAINAIWGSFNYKSGVQECLFSGSVGSSKTLLAAHIIVRHCIENPGAKFLLGRRALDDIRETIYGTICDHLEGSFREKVDYWRQDMRCRINFRNGSKIISRTWADRKYKKIRSINLSGAYFEELTENDDQDKQAYDETMMRIGRIPGITQQLMLCSSNPDGPQHWAYKHFIKSENSNRHVFYSLTEQNPFLPEGYADRIKENYDEKMVRRMLYGEWIDIESEGVYHSYSTERNHRPYAYEINEYYFICVSFDFNIGENKPLSACLFQYIGGTFHFFAEVIIDGARTLDALNEMANNGFLDYATKYYVHMDATGRARDTRSLKTDYDIIKEFFSNYQSKNGPLDFEMAVPKKNPPIRTRHNLVNAHCKNAIGQVRLYTYKTTPVLDEGFRLTRFKKNSSIEDDSKSYQHVGTAAGYGICWWVEKNKSSGKGPRSERIR